MSKTATTSARSATFENVKEAFKDQMRAHATYNLMARIAKKEDNILACEIFLETAKQELTHAEVLGAFLQEEERVGGAQEVCDFPVRNTTEENLEASILAEHEDRDGYKAHAETAKEEDFEELGYIFEGLSEAKNYHGARFETLLTVVRGFYGEDAHGWRCLRCGWISGQERPTGCQVCEAGENYFKPLNFENAANSLLSNE